MHAAQRRAEPVAAPPAGIAPDTVRTSSAANTCAGVDSGAVERNANPGLSAPSPMAIEAAAAKRTVRQPNQYVESDLTDASSRPPRAAGGSTGVEAEAAAIVSRTRRTSSSKAAATAAWGRRDVGFDCCALIFRDGIECVGRRQFERLELRRFSRVTPKQFLSPRSASRMRDSIVAKLVDNRSETWA